MKEGSNLACGVLLGGPSRQTQLSDTIFLKKRITVHVCINQIQRYSRHTSILYTHKIQTLHTPIQSSWKHQ